MYDRKLLLSDQTVIDFWHGYRATGCIDVQTRRSLSSSVSEHYYAENLARRFQREQCWKILFFKTRLSRAASFAAVMFTNFLQFVAWQQHRQDLVMSELENAKHMQRQKRSFNLQGLRKRAGQQASYNCDAPLATYFN